MFKTYQLYLNICHLVQHGTWRQILSVDNGRNQYTDTSTVPLTEYNIWLAVGLGMILKWMNIYSVILLVNMFYKELLVIFVFLQKGSFVSFKVNCEITLSVTSWMSVRGTSDAKQWRVKPNWCARLTRAIQRFS